MHEYDPVRISHLIAEDKLLWVYCCDCGHERDVNPAMVPLPAETPVPEVGKRSLAFLVADGRYQCARAQRPRLLQAQC